MTTKLAVAIALALATATAPAAFAQSTGGSPAAVNEQNKQVAPTTGTPSDPAAADNPAARVPTDANTPNAAAPAGAVEGAGTGEAGVTSPAGIPADPTTDQNVQPAPGIANPSDPATADKPAARVPTAP